MSGADSRREAILPSLPDTTLAVVLGDFGRDAAIRFCASLARAERRHICALLPADAPFFDEYRRMTLALTGDLPFVKQRVLRQFGDGALDERVLVGFPDGPTPGEVERRLSVTAAEAAAGPAGRGIRRMQILLPCNTLAPVSWAMTRRFQQVDTLMEALRLGGLGDHSEALARILVEEVRPAFPTVPDAVVREADRRGCSMLLPLGTVGIADVYRDAVRRAGSTMQVAGLDADARDIVLGAIGAAIERGPRRDAARRGLEHLVRDARSLHGEGLLAVEACTDLDYGVGLDSNEIYANEAVRWVYDLTGPDDA